MNLSIMDSRSLSSENYIHTSVYMEHFYEVAPMDWGGDFYFLKGAG